MHVVYSHLIGDLFTYGHLQMLEKARQIADYHVCGVITDRVASQWTSPLISNFDERRAVIAALHVVDEVIKQDSLDPTENLKLVHERFPNAKLCLIQSHHLGGEVLGASYVRSIGGEVYSSDFYRSLGRDFIRDRFLEYFRSKGSLQENPGDLRSIGLFRSKADTLRTLERYIKRARIEKGYVLTVIEWNKNQDEHLEAIRNAFPSGSVVVRSSSLNEDTQFSSNAGHYSSVLDVDPGDLSSLRSAVQKVVASYERDGGECLEDQILIQQQTDSILCSGVVFTRNLWSNTPYYLVNYDDSSGKTDTVTGGANVQKLEILRAANPSDLDEPWGKLLAAVKEIEEFFTGTTLDIEFAIKTDGAVVLFQVRPLAANARFHSLNDDPLFAAINIARQKYLTAASRQRFPLVLSDMAFWNPAELIGDKPAPLERSLFDYLIGCRTWNEALLSLGYSEVSNPLILTLGAKPYVVVDRAFRSLLPNTIPERLKDRLVGHYLQVLKGHPEWHDKIEFLITHNCYTFDFPQRSANLESVGFTQQDIHQLRGALLALTNDLLHRFSSIVIQDSGAIKTLSLRHEQHLLQMRALEGIHDRIDLLRVIVDDCRQLGTLQFTRMARLAFISNALLRSLETLHLISASDIQTFLNSISTVATELEFDLGEVRAGRMTSEAFLTTYGHLRPGTYDITRPAYKDNPRYFDFELKLEAVPEIEPDLQLEEHIRTLLDRLCAEHRVTSTGTEILFFIRKSIELREWFKFVYSRNICTALELIASIAERAGIPRQEAALLDYPSLVDHRETIDENGLTELWHDLVHSRSRDLEHQRLISLPPLVFSDKDLIRVPSYLCQPNFITEGFVEADCVIVEDGSENLKGRIVVIEKADPGFDWIFTKRIAGLITKYGGAASHMAIRCAEFALPAAIGVGDLLFSRAQQARRIILDCARKEIIFR